MTEGGFNRVDDPDASIETALSVAGYFRLSAGEARSIAADVERATADWQRVATDLGLPGSQISRMADAYETGSVGLRARWVPCNRRRTRPLYSRCPARPRSQRATDPGREHRGNSDFVRCSRR